MADQFAGSICAFVQARMSSQRFPGKVLAPFQGQPLIRHVISAVERATPSVQVIVATSREDTDDPLAIYLRSIGVSVFRGPLEDVFERFRMCVSVYPCDWILRISADSPLLDVRLLQAIMQHSKSADYDLVTTIFPRTFPRGQNAELIRVDTFMRIDVGELSAADREHVTPFFYRNFDRFQILNVESGDPALAEVSLAVDTVEDLHRLEKMSDTETRKWMSNAPFALCR